jgi:hypothetical protein
LYAQAADHPQRDVKKPYPLEVSSDPGPLTLETVASFCPLFTEVRGRGILRTSP